MTTQTAEKQQSAVQEPGSTRKVIRSVKQHTRRRFTAEEKIRIVLEGFSRELPVSD
jgi:transposase-like protein